MGQGEHLNPARTERMSRTVAKDIAEATVAIGDSVVSRVAVRLLDGRDPMANKTSWRDVGMALLAVGRVGEAVDAFARFIGQKEDGPDPLLERLSETEVLEVSREGELEEAPGGDLRGEGTAVASSSKRAKAGSSRAAGKTKAIAVKKESSKANSSGGAKKKSSSKKKTRAASGGAVQKKKVSKKKAKASPAGGSRRKPR